MLPYQTSVDATITYEINGVCIFETDCTVEIEYGVNDDDELEWKVVEFVFTAVNGNTARILPGHTLFSVLVYGLNHEWITERIQEDMT